MIRVGASLTLVLATNRRWLGASLRARRQRHYSSLRFGEHTRLACSDRRPRRSAEDVPRPETVKGVGRPFLFREGAEQSTRGRVRSPFLY